MAKLLKIWMITLLIATAAVSARAERVEVTDLAGRTIQVEVPVKAIVLGEGRHLPALGILDREDPVSRIVGMMGDFEKYDPAGYESYLRVLPHLADVPRIGAQGAESFSVERVFTVRPDLAIFGLGSGHGPNERSAAILQRFEAAGIPVVLIDFRRDPLVNTPKSIALLGKLFGREAQAAEFLRFYDRELAKVENGLDGLTHRPSVLLEGHVGMRPSCCAAFGDGMMGRFVTWAGGRNAYAHLIPGDFGMVNPEHLITLQPDLYIGTAIGSARTVETRPGLIALGAGTDAATARKSLQRATTRTAIKELQAVKQGRAYAVWHHFYNSPMNVVAVQAMAKWIHPDRFVELKPQATLRAFFDRFQPVELDGAYWIDLGGGDT